MNVTSPEFLFDLAGQLESLDVRGVGAKLKLVHKFHSHSYCVAFLWPLDVLSIPGDQIDLIGHTAAECNPVSCILEVNRIVRYDRYLCLAGGTASVVCHG